MDALAGTLGSLELLGMAEEVAALDAVLVHRHRHGGELLLDLHGLVAVDGGGVTHGHLLEMLALALVAAREHRHVAEAPVVAALERAQEHLSVRSLACAADGYVADADGRDLCLTGLAEKAFVVQGMTYAQDEIVWK